MSWNLESVKTLVENESTWTVESEGDCLSISNDEGIDAFLFVGEQQILVETALFPLSSVSDKNALNELILRTHQYQPLTTVGLKNINDDDYYIAFGSLSANSKAEVLIQEIETLFANVDDFIELYEFLLTQEAA